MMSEWLFSVRPQTRSTKSRYDPSPSSLRSLNAVQENDEAVYNDLMLKATCHTYMFACRAKQDTFNVSLSHDVHR